MQTCIILGSIVYIREIWMQMCILAYICTKALVSFHEDFLFYFPHPTPGQGGRNREAEIDGFFHPYEQVTKGRDLDQFLGWEANSAVLHPDSNHHLPPRTSWNNQDVALFEGSEETERHQKPLRRALLPPPQNRE